MHPRRGICELVFSRKISNRTNCSISSWSWDRWSNWIGPLQFSSRSSSTRSSRTPRRRTHPPTHPPSVSVTVSLIGTKGRLCGRSPSSWGLRPLSTSVRAHELHGQRRSIDHHLKQIRMIYLKYELSMLISEGRVRISELLFPKRRR